ncbi:protein Jumonji [Lates japonicus]|uniref:Protein Jumonji n=1 Tax=Lates japonicus TaxID=270547 RepID=A0AAD3NLK1_LATJO|nr:protein Jumonji [Lates japonicus]
MECVSPSEGAEAQVKAVGRRSSFQEKQGKEDRQHGGAGGYGQGRFSVTSTNVFAAKDSPNTMTMCFNKEPGAAEVEQEYWRIRAERQPCGVCIRKVDTSTHGSGFPQESQSHFSKYSIPAEEKAKLDKVVYTLLQANGTPGLEMLEKKHHGIKATARLSRSGQFVVCFVPLFSVLWLCCQRRYTANQDWMNLGYQAAKVVQETDNVVFCLECAPRLCGEAQVLQRPRDDVLTRQDQINSLRTSVVNMLKNNGGGGAVGSRQRRRTSPA